MVVPDHQHLIWRLLMEVYWGIHCLSPNTKWNLEVNHHSLPFLGDDADHAFGNSLDMIHIPSEWFVCCTASCEYLTSSHVVIFCVAINVSK